MKSTTIAVVALFGLASAPAHAVTVGFDSFGDGQVITGTDLGGVSITAGGDAVEVVDVVSRAGDAMPPLTVPLNFSLRNSIQSNPFTTANSFRADFSTGNVSKVSIGLGDFGTDQDDLYLRAFDMKGTLIDTSTATLGQGVFAFITLTVESLIEISYVEFGSTGAFINSVFADDLSFSITDPNSRKPQVGTVPLPAALPLLAGGLGLMGLLGWRRKRKAPIA